MSDWRNDITEYDPPTTTPWHYHPSLNILWSCQIVWTQISFILAIFGNGFVLYATIVHNAIKLDKMSVWIIKNLAVADICNSVLIILPNLITQYGKMNRTLIFGEIVYTAMGSYHYTFFVANLFLVNVLSLNKLMRCTCPLRNLNSTQRQRIKVSVVTAFVSFLPSLWIVYGLVDGFKEIADGWRFRKYLGTAEMTHARRNETIGNTRMIVVRLIIGLFNAVPCITLVIINSALVVFALRRSNSAVNKMGVSVVVMVTAALFISTMPHFADLTWDFPSMEFSEIASSIPFLSTWINPVIYFAVNPTFKEFSKRKLMRRCKIIKTIIDQAVLDKL